MCVWTQYDNGDDMANILEVKNLNAYYKTKSKSVFARSEKKQVLFDISFDVRDGEIFGIVGESGCGKSTLSKTILGMNPLYDGSIVHNNKKPQMIFQDPQSSLNERAKVSYIVGEGLQNVRPDLTAAQRELKNWGVLFTDGGRKKLITAEEARLLRSQGRQPAPGAVLTPLAREIMEGTK